MKMTESERELYQERIAIMVIDGKTSEAYAQYVAWKQIENLRKTKACEKDENN